MKNIKINYLTFLLLAIAITFSTTSNAQTLWGKEYASTAVLQDQKGDFNSSADKYVVTGVFKPSNGLSEAYLLETNQNGQISWQTSIGDGIHYWYGNAVKTTSNGDYIVVGKTTKRQLPTGVLNDTCQVVSPYYNAFIAHISPLNSQVNWSYVMGDSTFDDEAVEVIEDKNGNFLLVGTTNRSFSGDSCEFYDSCVYGTTPTISDSCYTVDSCCYGDSCLLPDSTYCLPGDTCCYSDTICVQDTTYTTDTTCYQVRLTADMKDYASILIAKFDPLGTPIFIKKYKSDSLYDQGVSIIEDDSLPNYYVLVNRRKAHRTNYYYPLVLTIDPIGVVLNQVEYDPLTTKNKIPEELIKDTTTKQIIVTGFTSDISSAKINSFLIALNTMLNVTGYAEVNHPSLKLTNRDILQDSIDLVISGEVTNPIGLRKMYLYKCQWNTGTGFTLLPLIGTKNLTLYNYYGTEENTNFCKFNTIDSLGTKRKGYHLFGLNDVNINSSVHHKTDQSTASLCFQTDSISIDNLPLSEVPTAVVSQNVTWITGPVTDSSNISLNSSCDTLPVRFKRQQANSISNEKIGNTIIYPNPTSGLLRIETKETIKSIEMYNNVGQRLSDVNVQFNGYKASCSLNNKPSGLYLIKVRYLNGNISSHTILLND